ncbi:FHA domain-containing protein [Sideroxydans lithotrophicus]|uniref:FHA domain containing protein n=1 Tax=Sideroxydans lithotrophicus (strain ES-1) TaxID=580332 RepID=D5CMT6_SIDLE|nr:FHA domain-containing protein [Sideroxydans lithotrophicus]ADE10772.1 FHA domain containing protein [Sideroxydans lithotrophicus ES-1]
MPAKLILSMDGTVLKEYPLNKERTTIGRKPHNDIVIDNLAVSSEHAAIVTILNDSFLEDLDSTNGLSVNGTPTKKHFLQNNDLIEIGKYKLKYLNDQPTQTSAADFEKTMVLRAPVKVSHGEAAAKSPLDVTVTRKAEATGQFNATSSGMTTEAASAQTPAAVVQILNGPNAGKELELVKSLTTLGKPGVQVAVLARRPHGYFITHVEGGSFPTVNGSSIGEQPHQLRDHDLIELAGVKMEFYFKT